MTQFYFLNSRTHSSRYDYRRFSKQCDPPIVGSFLQVSNSIQYVKLELKNQLRIVLKICLLTSFINMNLLVQLKIVMLGLVIRSFVILTLPGE